MSDRYWIINQATRDLAVEIPFRTEWRALAVADGLESESSVGSEYTVVDSLQ